MHMIQDNIRSNNMLTILAAYICIFYPLTDLGLRNVIGWTFLFGYWLLNFAIRGGRIYLTKYRIAYMWMAFVVLIFFLMPNAKNDTKSLMALIISIGICVLYILSTEINCGDIQKMMKIFIITAVLFSVYIIFCRIFPSIYLNTILPLLSGADRTEILRLSRLGYGAHIANSITYGPYVISIAAFFCLGDMLVGMNIIPRTKALVYEVLFIVAILCEGRRSELVGLIISAFIVYMVSTPNNTKIMLKRLGALLGIIIIGLIVVMLLTRYGFLSRFVNTLDLLKSGISINDLNKLSSSRFYLWQNAWALFQSKPIFGIGWGGFSENVVSKVNNVHNCYLQFLCEMGIVGCVAIILPMFLLLGSSMRKLKSIMKKQYSDSLAGNALIISVGMQLFFLLVFALDPVFYKGYYHMFYIILILLFEYSIKHNRQISEVV